MTLLVATGCSKDDNPVDSGASLVSTSSWVLQSITLDGQDYPPPYATTTLKFSSDKTFECDEYLTSGSWAPYYGKWEISNGKLNLVYDNNYGNKRNTSESYSFSVEGNKLKLSGNTIIADYSLGFQIPSTSKTLQEYKKD